MIDAMPRQRGRVLIVDDDPAMLRTVSRVLRRQYDLLAAESGDDALAHSILFNIDLAIVDVRMPGMNGFELTRRLKARDPSLDVILMTGNAEDPDDNLLRAIDEGAFYFIPKPFDRRVLLALVDRCLELRRLRDADARHVARLEAELNAARRFQESLIPPASGSIAGIAINARYLACTELAGDLYDYARAGERGVAMLIADVAGHGASAAMMTSLVKSAFHAAADDGFEPIRVIERTKDALRAFEGGRFVTLVAARLDAPTGALVYANAGHPAPIVFSAGKPPVLLESTGPLLSSVLIDLPHDSASVQLSADDSLFFYTDGVTETAGANGMFGKDRLLSLLAVNGRRGAALLDALLADLAAFSASRPPLDDITLLTLDRSP